MKRITTRSKQKPTTGSMLFFLPETLHSVMSVPALDLEEGSKAWSMLDTMQSALRASLYDTLDGGCGKPELGA